MNGVKSWLVKWEHYKGGNVNGELQREVGLEEALSNWPWCADAGGMLFISWSFFFFFFKGCLDNTKLKPWAKTVAGSRSPFKEINKQLNNSHWGREFHKYWQWFSNYNNTPKYSATMLAQGAFASQVDRKRVNMDPVDIIMLPSVCASLFSLRTFSISARAMRGRCVCRILWQFYGIAITVGNHQSGAYRERSRK